MHFLYKICRADNPEALCNDFKIEPHYEKRSYDEVQIDALQDVKVFITESKDVNRQLPEEDGATRLWLASERGHEKAVRELLKHPNIDPNRVKIGTKTTPLLIASHNGHESIVSAILEHPDAQVNLGGADSGISPLLMAVGGGREGVVEILLRQKNIDVNKSDAKTKVSPLCYAAQLGREHIAMLLLAAEGVHVNHCTEDGATAMSIASRHGRVQIIEMIKMHPNMKKLLVDDFPEKDQYSSDEQYCVAVSDFCSSNLPCEDSLNESLSARAKVWSVKRLQSYKIN